MVRNQLNGHEWSRTVGYISSWSGEEIEVWMCNENGRVSGIAILASEPRELTVANLVGDIDPDSLAEFGGHYKLPKLIKK